MESTDSQVSAKDELLGEDDCFEILEELEQVAHKWYDIGLALGLSPSTLDGISKGQGDIYELLRSMIVEWLKMSYNYEKFGKPTWRRIVEAVRATSGGRNPALADVLARKYGIMIQNMQPVINHTSTISVNHNTSSKLYRDICCCFLPGVSTDHNSSNRVTDGHKALYDKASTAAILQTSTILPWQVQQRVKKSVTQSLSESLPAPGSWTCDNQSNLTRTHTESKDITSAHPSWQIKDIAQQPGYWGAMTGEEAECLLRKYRGNCYLIRYSERRQHHILSVQARDIQKLTVRKMHFKLNITKEGDHTVYEIDGSEEKFTDISKLLEFYQQTPLTVDCSKFTIGEACT